MKREIIIGIITAIAISAVWWLLDLNTHDAELAPLENIARQNARRELRVITRSLDELDRDETRSPEEKSARRDLYLMQMEQAQADFDILTDDD